MRIDEETWELIVSWKSNIEAEYYRDTLPERFGGFKNYRTDKHIFDNVAVIPISHITQVQLDHIGEGLYFHSAGQQLFPTYFMLLDISRYEQQ